MIRAARVAAVAAFAATLALTGVAPAVAAPTTAGEPAVEFVVTSTPSAPAAAAIAAAAPGDGVWIEMRSGDGILRGTVGLVTHVGGYRDLYVCDARVDENNLSARIDPGDGQVLAYYDIEDPETCYNRDIWYPIRKFRAAWNLDASAWFAPPPL
jgi:hypothetical protein